MPITVKRVNEGAGSAVAVLLPGSGYTWQAPLLYWSGLMLAEAGWEVRAVEWILDGDEVAEKDPRAFVERAVESAFDASLGRRLIVAKSFGTLALPWAHALGVPGAWLTPICGDADVASALRSAPASDFIAGGNADPHWQPDVFAGTAATVHEVPGADHSLLDPAGWQASQTAHRHLVEALATHLG